jgi:hypothetical protein
MEKNNNINANRGCYIFIRDEFYICKLKVQNMNLNLVWIIQIGNREKKIKIEKGRGRPAPWPKNTLVGPFMLFPAQPHNYLVGRAQWMHGGTQWSATHPLNVRVGQCHVGP